MSPYRRPTENEQGTRRLKVVMHEKSSEIIDIESGESLANVDDIQVDVSIEIATGRKSTTVKLILTGIPIEYEERIIEGSVASIIEDETRLLEQKVSE